MTGSPLLRLFLIVVALGLLVFPITRITGRIAPEAPTPTQPPASSATPAHLQFGFTSTAIPDSIEIRALGSPVLELTPDATQAEVALDVPLPTSGVDLVLRAKWPKAGVPHALRVTITRDDDRIIDQTFWGRSTIEEVIPIEPRKQP